MNSKFLINQTSKFVESLLLTLAKTFLAHNHQDLRPSLLTMLFSLGPQIRQLINAALGLVKML